MKYDTLYRPGDTMTSMADRHALAGWLQDEMQRENLSQADVARRCGVDRQLVNAILLEKGDPKPDTLRALAFGLKIPPVQVFRIAGLLPPEVDADPWVERNAHRLAEMPEELRPIAESLLEGLLRQQERNKAAERKPKQRRA